MTDTALLAIAIVAGLYMAWNIGANDVANAMGTSVGSGALTLKRAIVLAAVFEFCGAYFVGGGVAQTIRKGIIDLDAFRGATAVPAAAPGPAGPQAELRTPPPDQAARDLGRKLAMGMLASLLAAALWLNIATFFGQPVSTTHAIVGAVVGFAVAAAGPATVVWSKMGEIAASWIISPICGGLLAYIVYRCIKRCVLDSDDPVFMARRALPLCFALVVCILSVSVLYKVLHMPLRRVLWQALPIALVMGLLAAAISHQVIRRAARNPRYGAAPHYEIVERWFARIQPVTACYMAFAHGANDVANAIGPLAGVIHFLQGGAVGDQTPVPAWLLAIGGAAIVVGLATYGYKVMEAVGKKITEITPTRGFAAEFGTASTVLVCSMLGLPVSTTFVLVGAVMGVGIARGFAALDTRVIRRIFASWLITIPVSAIMAAAIFRVFLWLSG